MDDGSSLSTDFVFCEDKVAFPGPKGRIGHPDLTQNIGQNRAPGRTRMARIPNVKRDTLTDFVLDHIARGAEVRTDAYHGYTDVGTHRFGHVVVNLKESGDPAHIAMPHVHRVASLLKRWLLGTHQGAVTHDQLDYYLDEFTFRFNRRRSRHRGLLFYRLIEGALAADPHPYATLVTPREAA